jgi:8-oxo-dGTP pyrophosphatase MutT (NUDIX family)
VTPLNQHLPFSVITQAELRLERERHPLEIEAKDRIDAEWQRRLAANPRLFDGDVVLATRMEIAGGRLHGVCRPIRYAGLLHFLGLEEAEAVASGYFHVYCWAAVVSGDGKALMGRMAAHTANAGRIFFPSGSLEAADFPGGLADIDGNMARELREETGLLLSDAAPDPHYLLARSARTAALMRVYRFSQSAAELVESAQAHLDGGKDDELDAIFAFAPGQTHPAMSPPARAFMAQFRG